jgi:group I intron endonuclease
MRLIDINRSEYTGLSGIYKLYFDIDNRFYIGSTNDLQERLLTHKRAIEQEKHYNKYLQRLTSKIGIENLKYEVLLYCGEDSLIKNEQYLIDTLKPELNLCEIAGRPPKNRKRGYKMTEEAKKNISNAKTGKKIDRSNYKHSEETLYKMSQSLIGRVVSDETKQKMKDSKKNGGKYSKLNKEQVKEIKLLVNTMFDKEIALMYDVSKATINQIKNNKIWKEV